MANLFIFLFSWVALNTPSKMSTAFNDSLFIARYHPPPPPPNFRVPYFFLLLSIPPAPGNLSILFLCPIPEIFFCRRGYFQHLRAAYQFCDMTCALFVCFLLSSSLTRLYRERAPQDRASGNFTCWLPHMRQSWETMTSVSAWAVQCALSFFFVSAKFYCFVCCFFAKCPCHAYC